MTDAMPRWVYRFNNYQRAFILLREAVDLMTTRDLTRLEKEGVIQRFEYTWELAWKLLKDFLDANGVVLDTITPVAVIRAAFAAKIIDEADCWMRALDARNRMSHTYDFATFDRIIAEIRQGYLRLLDTLHFQMMERVMHGDHG